VNAKIPFDIVDASVGKKWSLYDTCSLDPIDPSGNQWCEAGPFLCTTKCLIGQCPEGTDGYESNVDPPSAPEESESSENHDGDSADNGEAIQVEPVQTMEPARELARGSDENKEAAGTSSSSSDDMDNEEMADSSSAQSGGGCSTNGHQRQPTIPYSILLGILCLGLRRIKWG
jgi:hypothetical protein